MGQTAKRCGKRRFSQYRAAAIVVRYAKQRGNPFTAATAREECRIYHCEPCRAWHLTSKGAR